MLFFATSNKKYYLGNTLCFTRLEKWWMMRDQTENFANFLSSIGTLWWLRQVWHTVDWCNLEMEKKNSRDSREAEHCLVNFSFILFSRLFRQYISIFITCSVCLSALWGYLYFDYPSGRWYWKKWGSGRDQCHQQHNKIFQSHALEFKWTWRKTSLLFAQCPAPLWLIIELHRKLSACHLPANKLSLNSQFSLVPHLPAVRWCIMVINRSIFSVLPRYPLCITLQPW